MTFAPRDAHFLELVRELGYHPVPLREMVADCVDWLASEGLLPGVQSARRSRN